MSRVLKTPHDAPLVVDPSPWVGRALAYAARYANTSIHDDRIYDPAMDSLIRACQTHRDMGGRSFRNWLIMNVNRTMRCEQMKRNTAKKWRAREIVRGRVGCVDPEPRIDVLDEIRFITRDAPELGMDAINTQCRGNSPSAAGTIIGVSGQAVRNRTRKAVAYTQARLDG